jgi:hypothetical protein
MKIKIYLYHEEWSYSDEAKVVPWHIKFDDEISASRIRLFIKEVEVEIPDVKPFEKEAITKRMVNGLEKEKEAIQAETHIKLKAIDDRIQQLLCIEMKQEVV